LVCAQLCTYSVKTVYAACLPNGIAAPILLKLYMQHAYPMVLLGYSVKDAAFTVVVIVFDLS